MSRKKKNNGAAEIYIELSGSAIASIQQMIEETLSRKFQTAINLGIIKPGVPLIRCSDVCAQLSISHDTFKRWRVKYNIHTVIIGGSQYVKCADVEALIKTVPVRQEEPQQKNP